ncbi:hypothetical protein T08_1542 [Trichinella sp. T8]|nr:hypothetical protein T08_1542 [Trichinella sp. T8]
MAVLVLAKVGQSDVVVVDDRCCFSRAQLLCSPGRVNVLGGFSLLLFERRSIIHLDSAHSRAGSIDPASGSIGLDRWCK